jgi:hypothetical protein
MRPGQWLQLAPDYAGEFSDRAWVDVEVGETHDIGTLKLARCAGFEEVTVRHPEYEALEVGPVHVYERDAARAWELQPRPGLGKSR